MSDPMSLIVDPGRVTLADLRPIARSPVTLTLAGPWRERVSAAAKTVATVLARGEAVYGINTGFGRLADRRIDADALTALQRNLVLSHAAGTGPELDPGTVRLVLALKILGLAQGHSGVRVEVIDALTTLLAAGYTPGIPAQGSVGASGDLAPLAHLVAPLLGIGALHHDGRRLTAAQGLAELGMAPLTLAPKEGLALLNGTQVSTALAIQGLFALEDSFAAAVLTGALAVDGAAGSDSPFDARLHQLRRQRGQIAVAGCYRHLLAGSDIRAAHRHCHRVQDPYSLRCQPQVMGACLDQILHAATVLEAEVNAVTDNPLIFPERGEILSGGNFHAEPVALAADALAIAAAEIGSLAERRIAVLVDPQFSGLPAFLVDDGGINSGFMIAQVTAAALAAENKALANPRAVDSLPTSAGQEDHVSMATHAARRLTEMADTLNGILAIELLAAVQAIDLRAPHTTAPALQPIYTALRAAVPFYDHDRLFAPDIAAAREVLATPALLSQARVPLPSHREGTLAPPQPPS